MNTSNVLNVLLAIALVVLSVKIAFFSENTSTNAFQTANAVSSADAVIDNIMTRTSVRDYQDKAVDDQIIEKILRAGMAAPSAMNKQPWSFIVIKDKSLLQKLGENLSNASMTGKAPFAVVVCGDLSKTQEGEGASSWIQDGSAASENILLAAHALDLGAVWTGIYPKAARIDIIREMLNLPDNLIPLSLIPIGYPAETPMPKNKWKPENIHYNTWSNVAQ